MRKTRIFWRQGYGGARKDSARFEKRVGRTISMLPLLMISRKRKRKLKVIHSSETEVILLLGHHDGVGSANTVKNPVKVPKETPNSGATSARGRSLVKPIGTEDEK